MNCKSIRDPEFMDHYLLGRLPDAQKLKADQHIHSCSDCEQYVQSQRTIIEGIRAVGKEDLVAEIQRQAAYVSETKSEKFFRIETIIRLAAVVLFFVVTPFYFYYNRPVGPSRPVGTAVGKPDHFTKKESTPEQFSGVVSRDTIHAKKNKPAPGKLMERESLEPLPLEVDEVIKLASEPTVADAIDLPGEKIREAPDYNNSKTGTPENILHQFAHVEEAPAVDKDVTEMKQGAGITEVESTGSNPASAPTGKIKGKIKDEYGQPLSGVQVYIPELETGNVTDLKGEFSISDIPVGNHDVTIQMIGYEPVILEDYYASVDGSEYIDEQLREAPIEGSSIEIHKEKKSIITRIRNLFRNDIEKEAVISDNASGVNQEEVFWTNQSFGNYGYISHDEKLRQRFSLVTFRHETGKKMILATFDLGLNDTGDGQDNELPGQFDIWVVSEQEELLHLFWYVDSEILNWDPGQIGLEMKPDMRIVIYYRGDPVYEADLTQEPARAVRK